MCKIYFWLNKAGIEFNFSVNLLTKQDKHKYLHSSLLEKLNAHKNQTTKLLTILIEITFSMLKESVDI